MRSVVWLDQARGEIEMQTKNADKKMTGTPLFFADKVTWLRLNLVNIRLDKENVVLEMVQFGFILASRLKGTFGGECYSF